MVLAALLLICSIPQVDDAAKVVNDSPAVVADSAAKDASAPAALPSAPAPKVKADPEPIVPSAAALPFQPLKRQCRCARHDGLRIGFDLGCRRGRQRGRGRSVFGSAVGSNGGGIVNHLRCVV